MIFPIDALNVRGDIFNNATSSVFMVGTSSPYTVLYESFNTGFNTANGTFELKCGSLRTLQVNDFARVNEVERFKMAKCAPSSELIARVNGTSGNGTTTYNVIYVPYDIASSSPTSTVVSAPEFNYGVIILLVLVAIGVIDFFRRLFIKR